MTVLKNTGYVCELQETGADPPQWIYTYCLIVGFNMRKN